jgi:hypothetical protein
VRGRGFIVLASLSAATAAGCGDRLVDGDFVGDATLRLRGVIGSPLVNPAHAMVGAAWLGYAGFIEPTAGIETTALPITSIQFPPNFECDVLDAPPSVGRYAAAGGGIIPASMRLARLLLFDDADTDGRFALDAEARVVAPDQLLAASTDFALLFVAQAPADPVAFDGAGALLTNWEAAGSGYHVVALDPTAPKPALSGQVVANDTRVIFISSVTGAAF